MKVSFNKFFLLTLFICFSVNGKELGQKECFGKHSLIGHLLLSSNKKSIRLILHKGTNKEIVINAKKFNTVSYRCALEGCMGLFNVNIIAKENTPRKYTSSFISFVRSTDLNDGTLFKACGFI